MGGFSRPVFQQKECTTMELIRGPKPLTEIERAFAAEKYKHVKAELSLSAAYHRKELVPLLHYPRVEDVMTTGYLPEGFRIVIPKSGKPYIRKRQGRRLDRRAR